MPIRDAVRASESSAGSATHQQTHGGEDFDDDNNALDPKEEFQGELIFTLRPTPSKNKNAPPPRADWEFIEGRDTKNAKLGKTDPSKFFLCRQRQVIRS